MTQETANAPSVGVVIDTEAVADGQTGTAVRVNRWPVSVALIISGGASGKVQYTLSAPTAIAAGTANWHDWARGVVSASAVDYTPGPVTGFRGVSSSGAVTLEVVQ